MIVPIERISLPPEASVDELWRAVAEQTQAWLKRHELMARDAVLVLPFAALLEPARRALAAAGGWQPRVETSLTLTASLGPPARAAPGLCCGDTIIDRLTAGLLLRRQPWAAESRAGDPAGFERMVGAVVEAAQALRQGALRRPPPDRAGYWAGVRSQLAPPGGPAAAEALMLRLAVEWAAVSASSATDRLFDLCPAAWIVLRLGGPEPLAEALLANAGSPSLLLLADPPADDPFAALAPHADVQRILCEDAEAEAQAAAAEVIAALNEGRAPVALVAVDREGLRRVRALLARRSIPMIDETGWRLATTRAAADVMALLRAATPQAGPDLLLDWLKTWPAARASAIDSLEAQWRRRRRVPDPAAAQALWQQAKEHLRPLAAVDQRSLASWLLLVLDRLEAGGSLQRLASDAAGAQVLAALGWPDKLEHAAVGDLRLSLAEFIAWTESTLEELPFLPPLDAGAQVVLTPLSRAFGRPFRQLVVPGADHLRLGTIEPSAALIGEKMAAALGLDTAAARREQRRLALAQLLRAPRVTLLRRRREGHEAVSESPDVEWLLLTRAQAGPDRVSPWPLRDWQAATRSVTRHPISMPRPAAAQALPHTLSASQLEALRECPYRFFARAVLRLDEIEELDASLAKRDYGTWLHAVLHHFHSRRDAGLSGANQLEQAAEFVTRELAMDPAELLPFRASFQALMPDYLAWLSEREARGWHWHSGEAEHVTLPSQLGGLRLRGRIDRLDQGPGNSRQLLDYKTGSAQALSRRAKDPLEDTQLAFYAALLGGDASLSAAYLALDDANAPREIEHVGVATSAAALLTGLADEWQRLRQGAAMPALGEGRVCETCEARGVCRRDHWSAP